MTMSQNLVIELEPTDEADILIKNAKDGIPINLTDEDAYEDGLCDLTTKYLAAQIRLDMLKAESKKLAKITRTMRARLQIKLRGASARGLIYREFAVIMASSSVIEVVKNPKK